MYPDAGSDGAVGIDETKRTAFRNGAGSWLSCADEGIMLVASGNVVHLRTARWYRREYGSSRA